VRADEPVVLEGGGVGGVGGRTKDVGIKGKMGWPYVGLATMIVVWFIEEGSTGRRNVGRGSIWVGI
jgi:hypothetical protein